MGDSSRAAWLNILERLNQPEGDPRRSGPDFSEYGLLEFSRRVRQEIQGWIKDHGLGRHEHYEGRACSPALLWGLTL